MTFFQNNRHLGIFIFRVFLSLQILYGVQDNILSWARMLEFRNYLQSEGFPVPLISALVAVYVQFITCLLLLVGYKTRLATALLVVHFIVAVGVHVRAGDGLQDMFPALNILFGCLLFLFYGAGRPAVEPTN
ncbi:DoxX family protein [Flavihumibacter sp. CACIAM 22H1]|uniref:DoxX family protein n=1 Tax=Flavihumibacter sp. CACIAM 22H1 TaxID=1812911 RepID=UPI0025C369FC|nr:DoxX family protein [Flavihumibacter sp. CACIAM 22H1]